MAGPRDSLFVLNALADLVKPKQAGSEQISTDIFTGNELYRVTDSGQLRAVYGKSRDVLTRGCLGVCLTLQLNLKRQARDLT